MGSIITLSVYLAGWMILHPPAESLTTRLESCRDCNLIFISLDALQALHCGFMGYKRNTTPHLDRLAKRAFQFRQVYSVSSWTVPASMTWFTGVYPSEHRMVNKYARWSPQQQKLATLKDLSPNLITLAEVLKKAGYQTVAFTGNAGVSGGFGYQQGFDRYQFPKNQFGRMEASIPQAIAWLKTEAEKKFFMFLHGYDVHGQSMPAKGYDYRFVSPDYDKKYSGSPLEQELLREEGLLAGSLNMRQADVDFWRAIYDEKIQRLDAELGRLIQELQQRDLLKKTVIIITSDHGTELYEHQRFDHGFTLYQELIHVPLIIVPPLTSRDRAIPIRQAVSSLDLMPTILDILEIRQSSLLKQQLRGLSLLPLMNGKKLPARNLFSETDYREYTYKRALITPEGWKYILTMESAKEELYNLKKDPLEKHNCSQTEKKRCQELRTQLYTHFKSLGHDLEKRRWKVGMNPVYPSQGQK